LSEVLHIEWFAGREAHQLGGASTAQLKVGDEEEQGPEMASICQIYFSAGGAPPGAALPAGGFGASAVLSVAAVGFGLYIGVRHGERARA